MTLFRPNPAVWEEAPAIEAIRRGAVLWEPGAEDVCLLVVKPDHQIVLTSDQINERQAFPGEDVRSLVRRGTNEAVSDIAASGADLYGVQIDVRAPDHFTLEDFEAIGLGVGDVLRPYGGQLLQASNMSRGEFGISTTAVGVVPRDTAMRRSTARPGDILIISGAIGGWDAALAVLNSGTADELNTDEWDVIRSAFLDYRPEISTGIQLRRTGAVTSCIDTNDSLPKACADLGSSSGVGLTINTSSIPLAGATLVAARHLNAPPEAYALNGIAGDDRLLFTVAPSELEATLRTLSTNGVRAFQIGIVTDSVGDIQFRGGVEPVAWAGKRPTSIYGPKFSSSRPLELSGFTPAGRSLGIRPATSAASTNDFEQVVS
ncbi:hypothetical protein HP499_21820 [Paenarthrobacter sp. CM16]|uniref:thiamine-phosphate kinase n=1 Tax=Paenarthrobacter sp. CM16 TaxID=2738447 RepID=UPI0015536804|nr:AIR synthase related protein [Paenarthrobacter sp. CM16]NQD90425.1 hypothetical protein [Paenarthrobacter sp. CM16]